MTTMANLSSAFSWAPASAALMHGQPGHAVSLYRGPVPSWGMNAVKGAFGERLLARSITGGLFETDSGPWTAITPHRSGGAGIDKLFIRFDQNGQPRSVMVAEAKFGHSRLGETRAGRQMSDSWIRPRLAATARDYAHTAEALREHPVIHASVSGARALTVAIPGFGRAQVFVDDQRVFVHCRERTPPIDLVERQLRRTSRILADAAAGKTAYRPRLLRLVSRGHRFDVKLDILDVEGNLAHGGSRITGANHELHSGQRNLLREALMATLRDKGMIEEHAEAVADAALEHPRLLSEMHLEPEASWRVGLDADMAYAAGAGAFLAAVWHARGQRSASGTIDWKSVAKVAVLSGSNAALGYYVGVQIHVRLVTTEIGQKLMSSLPLRTAKGSIVAAYGGLGGAIVTNIFFALGAYWLGLVDARGATIMGTSGIAGATAGALFTSGAFGAAALFGTASTGTAISTLSGAAFTNAALAWFGGGAVAAGGGGMMVGAALLSGGAAVVAVVAGAGVRWGAAKLREREQRRLLQGRLHLVREHLGAARG